ncbi:hypothetical protein EST38_g8912 [Candolleomyces aberdarensis]|uniref:Nephrocystin 3-like N-terminal domain-containing protein n=1 Tax=Candolleomyces aberdarensis TaxID=2316362 RepID=A0A4Q2DE67_9AGAR|nr:hypothetical protein EST38_g8912 [Candolleomyces aberdarensis]
MAAAVPETAPFVRAAATARPGLKNFPVPSTSVAMQMQRLVYGPLKAAAGRGPVGSLAVHPFLIVIDGLDECENKDEVEDLIDGMLAFFDENPSIPLRVFITSRVEQHIQSRLNVPGVLLDNLVDHCSDDDITAFLNVLFQDASRRNPVIQAYVRDHGKWPTPSEKRKLVEHIGGSFIFASALFKFIIGSDASNKHPATPMDRLPLTLKMNPGLDGLYTEVLARSEHIPHFLNIISTIALLEAPLPTSGIAELLGINTYEMIYQSHSAIHPSATFLPPSVDQADSSRIRVITSASTFAYSNANSSFVDGSRVCPFTSVNVHQLPLILVDI